MLAVIAKFRAKDGQADEIIRMLNHIVPRVSQEEGTLYYTVNRDRMDPNLVVVIERYTDDAAFQAHSSNPDLADVLARSQALVEGGIEVAMLDELASIEPK